MERKIQGYGWNRDLPDGRDHMYAAPSPIVAALPDKVDLRPQCPPVYDQGALGSCTANAIGAAFQYDEIRQGQKEEFVPSRLFIYYNERVIEGTVESDSGAMIRDGVKSVAKQGVCPERDWKYDISKFKNKPPKKCYDVARKHQLLTYQRVTQTLGQLKGCLAAGFPFVFGFAVYESFESPEVKKTGTVPMPGAKEEFLGGHAVMAVGYIERRQRFIVRNSWGPRWGNGGYFSMPYPYLLQDSLSADFWTLRVIE
ncbi:MAG TPA: C1 family peptidase [Thermoleophilaceae bacterium]|jgi:C1A family cysteine protease